MKKLFTSALAIILLAGAVQAQETSAGRQGERKEHRKDHRKDMAQLNLSADQKTKLKAIHQREKAEMDALRSNTALSQEQRRTQAQQVREKYRAEMKTILTPEQQQKAEQMREEVKDHRGAGARDTVNARQHKAGKGHGKRGDGAHVKQMQKELNLTADQQQRIKAIRDQYRPQMEALRENKSLTQAQKKDKARELRKAQMDQVKAVLTPEQQEKMKSLRKGKGRKDAATR
ncbi:MAG: hypothetical protein EOO15_02285 [Chitinophagaceae bacterium]|nr:MAG: hypothetical protein EOO15_02285 [Chitinophagaceae bacterium]